MADDEGAADSGTALVNASRLTREMRKEGMRPSRFNFSDAMRITNRLRDELGRAGIKGFKRGGRVHRTGIYKLHRGERVIPVRSRRARRR